MNAPNKARRRICRHVSGDGSSLIHNVNGYTTFECSVPADRPVRSAFGYHDGIERTATRVFPIVYDRSTFPCRGLFLGCYVLLQLLDKAWLIPKRYRLIKTFAQFFLIVASRVMVQMLRNVSLGFGWIP